MKEGSSPSRSKSRGTSREGPFLNLPIDSDTESDNENNLPSSSQVTHLQPPVMTVSAPADDADFKKGLVTEETSLRLSDQHPSTDSLLFVNSTSGASNMLSIEDDDLQDFKHLQDDVKNILGADTSQWLRKPLSDGHSERSRSTRGSRRSSAHEATSSPRNQASDIFSDEYELQSIPLETETLSVNHFGSHSTPHEHSVRSTRSGYTSVSRNSDSDVTDTDDDVFNHTIPGDAEGDDEVGKSVRLYGKSLGLISPFNPWRLRCAAILLNKWYRSFSMLVLILYTIFLAYGVFFGTTARGQKVFHEQDSLVSYIITLVFNSFFTLELLSKVVAFGFWNDSHLMAAIGKKYVSFWDVTGIRKFYRFLELRYPTSFIHTIIPIKSLFQENMDPKKTDELKSSVTVADFRNIKSPAKIPRAFTRSSWGRLELLSTVSAWLAFGFSIKDFDDNHGLRLFRSLMAFRILKLVDLDSGLVSILRALKYGIPELLNVGFMLLYFWVFFGILAVQTFKGSFKRQCVWFNPNDASDYYQYDMQFCGGYLDAETLEPMNYIFADNSRGPMSKGFLCPANSKCISNANPYNGRISFDNIINSMELVFVIMSANTFTDLMYYTMDSDNMAASLFFVVSILCLTVWMINLLIAVLYSSFELVHERYTENKFSTKDNYLVFKFRQLRNTIKTKSDLSTLPVWSQKGITLYKKIEWLFVTAVFTSICALASIKSHSTSDEVETIFRINEIVAYLLLVETLMRLILYCKAPWKFLASDSYVYDFAVSIICVVLSVKSIRDSLGQTYSWLLCFPISRFYRVVVLFSVTRNLWKKVLKNAIVIWNLSAFYFLFVFLGSLIVLLYFDGTLDVDDMDETPFGFYSLPNAFLTLIKIGSTENWTDSLYALQRDSQTLFSAFFGSMLLILWFILANFVVLNVFVAVIAASFDIEEKDKRLLQIKHYLKVVYPERIKQFNIVPLLERLKRKFRLKSKIDDSDDFKQFLFRGTAILSIAQDYEGFDHDLSEDEEQSLHDHISTQPSFLKKVLKKLEALRIYKTNPFFKDPKVVFVQTEETTLPNKKYTLKLNEWEDEKIKFLRQNPSFNNAYFIFPPNHALRRFCQRLVPPSYGKRTNNRVFFDDTTNKVGQQKFFYHLERDIFVFVTFVATLLMVIYSCYVTPLYRMNHNKKWNWTTYFEPVFVPLFTIEFLVKTIADGFIYTPNAYWMNPWNRIDLIVLIALWIDFIAWLVGNGELARIIKAVSALRALRFLTISSMARMTFKQVMFDGLTYIFGACAVAFSILFPYTVWGLVVFRGRLGVCNDGSLSYEKCYNEFTDTVFQWDVLMPRAYADPVLHLNSFPSAFRSMYEIVSLEGWTDLLQNMMSSTGAGTPAELFASPYDGIFLIVFNFLSMVFILNIFVSFIVGNNARMKGTAYLTSAEKSWLEVKRLLSQAFPDPMPNVFTMTSVRRICYLWAVEKKNFYFSLLMQFMLYLHILTLLTSKDQPYGKLAMNQNIMFMVTTSFLLIQEAMHIYGKSLRLYVRKSWNIFRSLVIVLAFASNIYELTADSFVVGISNARDIFQLGIFLLVIPQNDTLKELVSTATASLPSIFSLVYTWFILFLVYAIALNQVFGLTKLGPNSTGNINCRTVTKSLILLFRCSFGEGWNYIMSDFTLEDPFCYTQSDGTYTDCGSKSFAYALLMSWNILSMYIFVNMFVSLIVEKFSYVYHREQNKDSPASQEEVRKFKLVWREFDPDGVGRFDLTYLPKFMHSFEGPLSFKIWEGRLSVKSLVSKYMEVNPLDPYDVKIDYKGLNNEISSIDYTKVNERRLEYNRFIHEIQLENKRHGAVEFSQLMETVPLYTTYDKTECLGIDDYVKTLYNMNKIDRLIRNERNYDTMQMIVCRWKFLLNRRKNFKLPRINVPISSYPNGSTEDFELEFKSPILNTQESKFMWSPSRRNNDWFEENDIASPENRSRTLIKDTSTRTQTTETSSSSSIVSD
ncbi:unnamed protein product [Kluyveromyces dobzhanskii CBS 2104]|uniref:Calcium-channel protein CCH1 n=1 Tax=Kluyveromyces dobzhanskii CBS 2104 TaxID=1427455 RepID=A0A0A8L6Z3_9SACH|nr:unnamed protein product [Kluyveromyces dobzhanskii CBS 2104]